MGQKKHLLLHVPHSSTSFPKDSRFTFEDLDFDERLLIDYYTDELFIPKEASEEIGYAVSPYCRLFCDVERLMNDPLDEKGLGFSYSREIPTEDGHSVTILRYKARRL